MKKVTGLQTFIEAQTSGKARAVTFFVEKIKVTQDRKKIWKNSYYQTPACGGATKDCFEMH